MFFVLTFFSGLLRSRKGNFNLMPPVAEIEKIVGYNITYTGTYIGGDNRVNENPSLASFHNRELPNL